MKSFEEHLAREQYMNDSKDRAWLRKRTNRQLTRKEREQQAYKTVWTAVVIIWAVFLAAVFAAYALTPQTGAVDTTQAPEPVEEPAEAVVEAEPAEAAEEPEDFENEKIEEALLARANKIDDCIITYYCTERRAHICGTGTGKTASGRWVQAYVSCAVDPSIIPLGSTVMVDYGDGELHYYRADDIGAWVNGAHVDLAVTTHDEALQLGRTTATIYWSEEGKP